MPKSANYSPFEFKTIEDALSTPRIINNIVFFEKLCKEIERTPWSVYNFIKRKFFREIFTDKHVKAEFHLRYKPEPNPDLPVNKKGPYKKKAKPEEDDEGPKITSEDRKRWAVYSNFNVDEWKKGLLKD